MIKILYIFNFETKEKLRILSLKDELTAFLTGGDLLRWPNNS